MRSIKIGAISLNSPVILAPMSGVTDLPFRRLVKREGAGLVVSEMIASQAMIRATRESLKLSQSCGEEFPMAVQLAGCDPEIMAEAARLNVDRGAAIIDINFGCPVKKIVNKQAGSALMRDEALAGRILEAVVAAVPVPVTLKMRLGWDETSLNAPNLARIAEKAGIQMITVHGRTRCQFYGGVADWKAVRRVKDATALPVVVNGDIDSFDKATSALTQSGADGVMIGRGAYGKPWLLSRVMHFLETGERLPDPTLARRRALALEHYNALLGHYGTEHGVRVARKHMSWALFGLAHAAETRNRINQTADPAVVQDLIRRAFGQAEEALAA